MNLNKLSEERLTNRIQKVSKKCKEQSDVCTVTLCTHFGPQNPYTMIKVTLKVKQPSERVLCNR